MKKYYLEGMGMEKAFSGSKSSGFLFDNVENFLY